MTSRVLYQPKGRAREYAEWAVNLYEGCCPHRCLYCWVATLPKYGRSRDKWLAAPCKPRDNVLRRLLNDLRHDCFGTQPIKRQVQLCFTCDPYPWMEEELRLTRAVIETLHSYGQHVRILTKAGVLAQRDFDLLGPQDAFGVTLTCLYNYDSLRWEPGAARIEDRLDNLQQAHRRDIPTWVSLEPVIYPKQSLALIELTAGYVDEYRLGTLNYHPHARTIDWADYGKRAVVLLESLGKRYILKRDLQEKMP